MGPRNDYRPPNFGSLQFVDYGDGSWRADITHAHRVFWRHWSINGTRGRLTRLGFKLRVEYHGDEEDWYLEFRAPANLDPQEITRVIAETAEEEKRLPAQVLFGEPRDETERRQQRRDLQNEQTEREVGRRLSGIEDAARNLLHEYGEFASDRPLLRKLLSSRVDWPYDADRMVKKAREKTVKRTKERLAKAEVEGFGDADVDWTDDEVRRAVTFLTSSDFDHASIANDRGWSSADSSAGWWCAKMLKDPENSHIALAAARGLVGKYARQLVSAGVIYRDRVVEPRHKKRKAA